MSDCLKMAERADDTSIAFANIAQRLEQTGASEKARYYRRLATLWHDRASDLHKQAQGVKECA